MPLSFEQAKVRNAYLKIKKAQKDLNTNFSEKTVEYFLQVFKSLNMHPEIVDACDSFVQLTGVKNGDSEIKKHYLSDALLRIPAK